MAKRVFTQEQDQEVARLYGEGLSTRAIAQRYGVDKSSVSEALKRQGATRRDNRAVNNKEELRLCELYQSGLTMTEISQDTGLSFAVIKAALSRRGTKRPDDRYTFTPEQEKGIIEAYQAGQTMTEIGEQQGAELKTIRGVLQRNDIAIRDGRMFTDKQGVELAKLYIEGMTTQQIADLHNVSRNAVENALDLQGVKMRSRRINFFNEQAFDSLDSELPLYWLGFLYADSNVSHSELKIGLSAKDLAHLESLRRFMKSDARIRIRQGKTYKGYTQNDTCSINFASRYLVNRLKSLGFIVRRGNFVSLKPHIPNELTHHFIRGYLDGDGCISTNQQVVFLGQPDILEWIRETLYNQAGASLNNKIRQRRGICEVSWGGINQARRIVDYLYQDATIYLERKKKVADNWK